MTLQLIKIEDGVCQGATIYHKFVEKTEIEIKELDDRKRKERELKAQRRAEQEANVLRKQQEKEERARAKEERKISRETARTQRIAALENGADDAQYPEIETSDEESEESEDEMENNDYSDDGEADGRADGGLDQMNLNDEVYGDYSEEEGEIDESEDDDDDEEESQMKKIAGEKFQQTMSSKNAKRSRTQ